MGFEKVEDITVNYEKEGKLLVKEVKKEVLSHGVWATILFLYQQFDEKIGEYKEYKICLRRYKKIEGFYQLQSKFTFSSDKQAKEIASTISKWVALYGAE
jgi:hypothetical protein